MKMMIFGVRDEVVAAYVMPPFFCRTEAEARRILGDVSNDKGSQLYKNPQDFKLFGLGSIDDGTGVITPLVDGPKFVCDVVDLVVPFNNDNGGRHG